MPASIKRVIPAASFKSLYASGVIYATNLSRLIRWLTIYAKYPSHVSKIVSLSNTVVSTVPKDCAYDDNLEAMYASISGTFWNWLNVSVTLAIVAT